MSLARLWITVFVSTSAGFSQEVQSKPELKFEVASVKVTGEPDATGRLLPRISIDDAQVNFGAMPLISLISQAYAVKLPQILGPAFLYTSRFNISAKIPAGMGKDRVPEMFQRLLEERLGLVVHRETRIIKGYVLTVHKEELLAKSKATEEEIQSVPQRKKLLISVHATPDGGRGANFVAASFTQIAEILGGLLGTPILDNTNASGLYTMVLDLPWGDAIPYSGPPDPATAIETLALHGLKFQAGQFPLDYLVVDKVNKVPTEN